MKIKNEDIKKELEGLSKVLADVPKMKHMDIPDEYFEKLPNATWNKLSLKVDTSVKEKTKVISLIGKLASVAASVALLFFVFKNLSSTEAEIPMDTMVEFIIDDLGELDEDFLFELHDEVADVAELDDETLDYMLDEEIDLIDDNILKTLY